MSWQDSEAMPSQTHRVWTLADLATRAARREVAAGMHHPHADRTRAVASDACRGRRSKSHMTPEE